MQETAVELFVATYRPELLGHFPGVQAQETRAAE